MRAALAVSLVLLIWLVMPVMAGPTRQTVRVVRSSQSSAWDAVDGPHCVKIAWTRVSSLYPALRVDVWPSWRDTTRQEWETIGAATGLSSRTPWYVILDWLPYGVDQTWPVSWQGLTIWWQRVADAAEVHAQVGEHSCTSAFRTILPLAARR